MTASQWIVLDNVKNHWPYGCNVNKNKAEEAYTWLKNNGYVREKDITKDITPAGELLLMQTSGKHTFDPEET